MGLGNRVYGAAGIALGVIGLVWHDFAAPWHAVPPELLAPTSAAYTPLAYAYAVLFLIGGVAMQTRRGAAGGALMLAALFAVFALLWGYRASQYPGIFGIWLGVAEESAMVIGGVVAAINVLHDEYHPRRDQIGRIAFGLCLLAFGTAHILYVKETAAMVPAYLPRQDLWAYATGVADILAGAAFLSGIMAVLASRLVVLMFIGFGALVWAPQLMHGPAGHMSWAGNAINLALIGAAWVLADSIAAAKRAW
jgi:uncharacterized membrane protein YphA (DoxX/SURF4 family)